MFKAYINKIVNKRIDKEIKFLECKIEEINIEQSNNYLSNLNHISNSILKDYLQYKKDISNYKENIKTEIITEEFILKIIEEINKRQLK